MSSEPSLTEIPANPSDGAIAPHKVLPDFYPDRSSRAAFVTDLFDRNAHHYDWLSSALSFGSDKAYRKFALRRAGLQPQMKVLDVATGTGLVAQAALDLGVSPENLNGLDPSRGMLEQNRQRHGFSLFQGMGEALPFKNNSFDFVTMGYALRHVNDLRVLFQEFGRVLRPEGKVLILEISRPESRLGFALGRLYLYKLIPLLSRLILRSPEASRLMKFYWATIAECVPPQTILAALSASGFTQVVRRKTGSMLSDYCAVKS